jgi:hypothetical protein
MPIALERIPRLGAIQYVLTAAADLQRLMEGVGDHAGVLGGGDPPAEDAAGEHVDDEGDLAEAPKVHT